MDLHAFLVFTVKMNKTAHRMQKAPGNRKTKAEAPGKTAASRLGLIKLIAHLRHLGIRHADSRVINIYNQIDSVSLLAIFNTDADTALFRKLKGIFQKDFKDMGNLFHISNQYRRYFRIHIKYDFQPVPAVLHGNGCNHVIQQGRNHIRFFCRSQRALHNLGIIQNVIDLIGQTLARHLDGQNILPQFRGKLLFQRNLADTKHHINGRPDLMGNIRHKFSVLPPCRF